MNKSMKPGKTLTYTYTVHRIVSHHLEAIPASEGYLVRRALPVRTATYLGTSMKFQCQVDHH